MKLPREEIERMIAMMEQAACDENERMAAMSTEELYDYLGERDAATQALRDQLIAQGVPPDQICIGAAELLVALQKALDGTAPTIH